MAAPQARAERRSADWPVRRPYATSRAGHQGYCCTGDFGVKTVIALDAP
jgi:hypothetical protein